MFIFSGCLRSVIQTNGLLLKSFKGEKFKTEPYRLLFSKAKKPIRPNSEVEKTDLSITGIDDPKFVEVLSKTWYDWNIQKEGFRKLCGEFKLFYEETIEKFRELGNERLDDTQGRIDMLFKFETEEDLKRFSVATDKDFNSGFSSASLSITDHKTGVFCGNISMEPPKTEAITRSGFANMNSCSQYYSFFREKLLDLSEHTHLVLKIRGDGRTYLILLRTPHEFTETSYMIYKYPLYTRGGPYWQIAKLPVQSFFLTKQGRIIKQHDYITTANKFTGFGITVTALEGPFKLEIDYIGLEFKDYEKPITPYEDYNSK